MKLYILDAFTEPKFDPFLTDHMFKSQLYYNQIQLLMSLKHSFENDSLIYNVQTK